MSEHFSHFKLFPYASLSVILKMTIEGMSAAESQSAVVSYQSDIIGLLVVIVTFIILPHNSFPFNTKKKISSFMKPLKYYSLQALVTIAAYGTSGRAPLIIYLALCLRNFMSSVSSTSVNAIYKWRRGLISFYYSVC